MNDFQTSPELFVFIVLFTSIVVAVLGGWKSISVEIAEEEPAAKPDESGLPAYSKAA
jgi:hypothetical protein